MKIETTITGIKDGVVLFEQDVNVYVIPNVDRWNELNWVVDQYTISGTRRVWDDTAGKWCKTEIEVAVPDKLADVFDVYLDRANVEEAIRDRLIEADELERDEGDAEHASAYRAAVL
jgi:hypothetical protein